MRQPATSANQISKDNYHHFGGCLNPDLQVRYYKVGHEYRRTYHHTGIGVMRWRNDKYERKNYGF